MLITHYEHRLPADYDTAKIRLRARERGALWDQADDLYFKAFLLRVAGEHGAIASSYSSLYLWRHEDAWRDFLLAGRYATVTGSFGRAPIEQRLVLDARLGASQQARFAYKEERPIAADADLSSAMRTAVAHNQALAAQPGTVAAAAGIDTWRWTLTHILLSSEEPDGRQPGTAYQIVHLSRPLLASLDRLDGGAAQ